MPSSISPPKPLNDRVLEKLQSSELYQTYRAAFLDATGLPLSLEAANEKSWLPCRGKENRSTFCQLLSQQSSCELCSHHCNTLGHDAEKRASSLPCFAGLTETAVPVKSGAQTIAFLTTGQIFHEPPSKEAFPKIRDLLIENGFSDEKLRDLEDAYLDCLVVDKKQYKGITTLLAAFSLQLSSAASQLALEEQSEPVPVSRAKQYVNAHLDEKITLEDVASYVNVSTFYFCKVFKSSTGMTLTEYLNRRRIERAKKLLLRPGVRVTEIAYDIGYQSLSQFNRSFLKYAASSPTEYRRQQSRQGELAASV